MNAKNRGSDFPGVTKPVVTNRDDLLRALDWIFHEQIFAKLAFHGNVKWTPNALVRLAIFWVWNGEPSLVQAANEAIDTLKRVFGIVAVGSYQALTGALKRYTPQLLPPLWSRLHHLMETCDKNTWRVGPWLALAVDGSRLSTPRTLANEQRFCKPRSDGRRKRKNKRARHANCKRCTVRQKSHYDPQAVGPQMWLTLLWHIGQRMPWCWEIGPSYSSERDHMLQMLHQQNWPENTLFCGDAGFAGYTFWRTIHDQRHHFLMRVGGNVRLLKCLGYVRERNGIVYCWPDKAMKKKQPPLVLSLLQFRSSRGDVYLVTNVLSENHLTLPQARQIYLRRWGVELQFRAFKQTYQRAKLKSRTPDCAEVELHWSLLGLWIIQLLAFKEQTHAAEPREQTSIATVLRILRSMIKQASTKRVRGQSLQSQLAGAVTDGYERPSTKQSRNYPRRKEEPSAGAPIICPATEEHKKQLHTIQCVAQAA